MLRLVCFLGHPNDQPMINELWETVPLSCSLLEIVLLFIRPESDHWQPCQ